MSLILPISSRMSNVRPIDDMLKAFLVDISDQPPESLDATGLLKECLESVLPICNGKFQAKGFKADPSNIKSHLAA